jgi:hypothetical protein
VRLHGIPTSILSDRDPIFVSSFWRELFKLQGTQLKMNTAHHPQTDKQIEVVNWCFKTFLQCFIADQPKQCIHWLPWTEYWFNTNFHVSTGTTPFESVYGRAPPVLNRFLSGAVKVEAVHRELKDRDGALKQLKYLLQQAQDRLHEESG